MDHDLDNELDHQGSGKLTEQSSITQYHLWHGRSAEIMGSSSALRMEMRIYGYPKPFQEIIVSEEPPVASSAGTQEVAGPNAGEVEGMLVVLVMVGLMELGVIFCAFTTSLYRNIYSFGFLQSGNVGMWLDLLVLYSTISLASLLYVGASFKMGQYFAANPPPPPRQSVGISLLLMVLFIANYYLLPSFQDRALFLLPFPLYSAGLIALTIAQKGRTGEREGSPMSRI